MNHLAAKAMLLNYVAPVIKDGVTIVELYMMEVKREKLNWNHALILYIVGA